MQIDPTAAFIPEREAGRQAGFRLAVMFVAHGGEGIGGSIQKVAVHYNIEIVLIARLLPQEGVHTPTSIEPEFDAFPPKCIQCFQHISRVHHHWAFLRFLTVPIWRGDHRLGSQEWLP